MIRPEETSTPPLDCNHNSDSENDSNKENEETLTSIKRHDNKEALQHEKVQHLCHL